MINIWKAAKKSQFFEELCEDVRDAIWSVYEMSGFSISFTSELLGVPKSTLIDSFRRFVEDYGDQRFDVVKKQSKNLVGASWREFNKNKQMGNRVDRLGKYFMKKNESKGKCNGNTTPMGGIQRLEKNHLHKDIERKSVSGVCQGQ